MRWLAAAGVAIVALASCGSDSALEETASKLNDVDSAVISLDVTASTGSGASVGFALEGPFSFKSEADLPVAELELTERRGDAEERRIFVATGTAAFVVVDGQAYELPEDIVRSLRLDGDGDETLSGLDLAKWFDRTSTRDGPDRTEVITGEADAVRALRELLPLMGALGGPTPGDIDDATAKRLAAAVEDSELTVVTGREDRILRRLDLVIRFGANSAAAREALGELGAPQLEMSLELTRVNEPVTVQEPADPRPYSELG